jgi:predicted TIM-barrel fold metal-dependent hydrolase
MVSNLDRAGVQAAVCMALDWELEFGEPPAIHITEVHRRYGQMQKGHPGRMFAVAGVDPRRPDADKILEDAVSQHGLRGLKVYPPCGYAPGDPVCDVLYRKCLELDVPVVIHTAFVGWPHVGGFAHPLGVGDVQRRFPELHIVFAHSGHPYWGDEAIAVASYHPRSYLELSNWNQDMDRDPESLVRKLGKMRDAVGAHRMLFASDNVGGRRFGGERSTLRTWVEFFQNLPDRARSLGVRFTKEEVDMILGENARRVFRLDLRAG